jgi:hypothetical protein
MVLIVMLFEINRLSNKYGTCFLLMVSVEKSLRALMLLEFCLDREGRVCCCLR